MSSPENAVSTVNALFVATKEKGAHHIVMIDVVEIMREAKHAVWRRPVKMNSTYPSGTTG